MAVGACPGFKPWDLILGLGSAICKWGMVGTVAASLGVIELTGLVQAKPLEHFLYLVPSCRVQL